MATNFGWLALAGGVLLLIARAAWTSYSFNKKYKFPNRMPGWPIVGNTFQVPPYHQGPWAHETAKKYGEMFTCHIGANDWVFLNSSRVVNDLLEKRSGIYSSRQEFPMAQGVISGNNRILLMPYGERWRSIRKIMHAILNKTNAETFAPFQDLESKHLLYDYLHHPDEWYNANQRFANSIIMSVVFGKRFELGDPNTRRLFETSSEFILAIQPGASLVDGWPVIDRIVPSFLKWWVPRGRRLHEKTIGIYRREVGELREKMAKGIARPCFGAQFLQKKETAALGQNYGEDQILFSMGSLMEAGSDTSRMSISQVIAAAATDPSWINPARAELDAICGANAERLPNLSDRDSLPYISAVVKEAFRWRPFAEIGVPHMLTQDDEYEGYKFPKGTLFTWNAWHMSMSEDEYEQPSRFWPERWLNGKTALLDPLAGHWSFGPGQPSLFRTNTLCLESLY